MKKHLRTSEAILLTSAIALVMAGCQSAQKNTDVASTEDRAFDQEVLDTYNRPENVSSLMSYYEEEIKSGQWKLSQFRKAERSIASAVNPIVDLIQAAKNPEFEKDAIARFNRAGRARFKDWKDAANLEGVRARVDQYAGQDPHFAVDAADDVRRNLIGSKTAKYSKLRTVPAVIEAQSKIQKAIAKRGAEASASRQRIAADGGRMIENEKERLLEVRHAENVARGNGVSPVVIERFNAAIDQKIKEVDALEGVTDAQKAEMRANLTSVATHNVNYHKLTFGNIMPLKRKGCSVVQNVDDSKNMVNVYKNQVDFVAKYSEADVPGVSVARKNTALPACNSEQKAIIEFKAAENSQIALGRTGPSAAMAVRDMGSCGLGNTNQERIANRVIAGESIKIPNCRIRQ